MSLAVTQQVCSAASLSTPVNEPVFAPPHVNVNYGAQKTVVCLSLRAKSILTKETVGKAWNFNHGDKDRNPHFLQECLWYQCSIRTRQYTDFVQLVPHRKQEKVIKANKDCREVIVCWLDCTFVTINLCFPCFWMFRWLTVEEVHFRTAWKIWKTTVNLHTVKHSWEPFSAAVCCYCRNSGQGWEEKYLLRFWSSYYLTNMFCRLLHTGVVMGEMVSRLVVLLAGEFRVLLRTNIKIWCETRSLQHSVFCVLWWPCFSGLKSVEATVFKYKTYQWERKMESSQRVIKHWWLIFLNSLPAINKPFWNIISLLSHCWKPRYKSCKIYHGGKTTEE